MILQELSRKDLLNKSKYSDNGGKQRFKRRLKSKIMNSTKEINNIDMDKLFRKGILTVDIKVQGETDQYLVKVSVGSFVKHIQRRLRTQKFDIRTITQAIMESMNDKDVYVHCSCPDFKYRYAYWSTRNKYNSGEKQPSNGKWIRNPLDDKGSACKHTLLVLSNLMWVQTVARTIYNYVLYMEEHYEDMYARLIYPKLYYRKKYNKDTQIGLFDTDELQSDNIQDINDERAKSTQFKQGNKAGYKFTSDEEEVEDDNQLSLDL